MAMNYIDRTLSEDTELITEHVNTKQKEVAGIRIAQDLLERIKNKEACIGVVGLGYVGLPLAVEFALKGYNTVGIDLNKKRVEQLNQGINYNPDLVDKDIEESVKAGKLMAQSDFSKAGRIDVFFICVPTPVTAHKDPDTSYIKSASEEIARHLRKGQLIILKSTTYPDTTEGLVKPILEEVAANEGLNLGTDYFLAFSPERIDPGNKQFTTTNTPIVVGGVTKTCTELTATVMEQIVDHVHQVSSPKVAEMEKLLENTFRSVNIALVNELARLCDRMGGISMWEVIEAASTKPFGFMPFYPGPGLGGHCIPIDPYYLSWLARRYDFETSFITLSARINEDMPFYVVESTLRTIADQPVRLDDADILILGVAFKRDVDDTRHSPALRIIELLIERGVKNIKFCDPHVDAITVPSIKGGMIQMEATPLTEEVVTEANVVVVLTDHSAFPYGMIAEKAEIIVDTRNAFKDIPHSRNNVLLLGGGTF